MGIRNLEYAVGDGELAPEFSSTVARLIPICAVRPEICT